MPACFCQWWWLVPGCCDHTAAPPTDTHWCSGNLPQSNTWSSTKENRDKMANITVFRPKVVFCYDFFITFQGYLLNHNVCERKGFKCWKRCRLEQDGSATPSCKCVLCVYMYVQLCVCIEESMYRDWFGLSMSHLCFIHRFDTRFPTTPHSDVINHYRSVRYSESKLL